MKEKKITPKTKPNVYIKYRKFQLDAWNHTLSGFMFQFTDAFCLLLNNCVATFVSVFLMYNCVDIIFRCCCDCVVPVWLYSSVLSILVNFFHSDGKLKSMLRTSFFKMGFSFIFHSNVPLYNFFFVCFATFIMFVSILIGIYDVARGSGNSIQSIINI